jgi:hypothetical protein
MLQLFFCLYITNIVWDVFLNIGVWFLIPQLPLPILLIEIRRTTGNGILVVIVIILTARNYHYTDKNDKHS